MREFLSSTGQTTLERQDSSEVQNPTGGQIFESALHNTENYLLRRTTMPLRRSIAGFVKYRDPAQRRQNRLAEVSEGECETASAYYISQLLPEIDKFPIAALVKSRDAMHEEAPVNWNWHTGVLVFDGVHWNAVSPANYSKDNQPKRIISGYGLQEVLDTFGDEEHCRWPSATYISEQFSTYTPPYIERSKTDKGLRLPYLHTQMYMQDGTSSRTLQAKLLYGF